MLRWTALTDYHGLLNLMLNAEQSGLPFVLNGVPCTVGRIDECHGLLEAFSGNFGFAAFFSGWYGDYSSTPVHVVIVGEPHTCIGWLPIEQADKLALIQHLPLSPVDQMLCRLSV